MKDRVREAIFNLVGPSIEGTHAIDLFAGTGAIGLEAISRGAVSATLIEKHVPTAKLIRQNIEHLGVAEACELLESSAFLWGRRDLELPASPWAIFCSPPYDFYIEREAEMLALIERLTEAAPDDSIVVVEADNRFDFAKLPHPDDWRVRSYPPAVVGILRKSAGETANGG